MGHIIGPRTSWTESATLSGWGLGGCLSALKVEERLDGLPPSAVSTGPELAFSLVGAPRGSRPMADGPCRLVDRKTHFCDWGLRLACTVKFRGFPMFSGLGPLPSAEIIAAAGALCLPLGGPNQKLYGAMLSECSTGTAQARVFR